MSDEGKEFLVDAVFEDLLGRSTMRSPAARYIQSMTPQEITELAEEYRAYQEEVDEVIDAITPAMIEERLRRLLAEQGWSLPEDDSGKPC